MKNILLGLAGGVAVLVIGFVVAVSMQRPATHIERSITMAATPADVFPYVNNFDRWMAWNPWQGLDPDQKVTFSDVREGKGAWYAWDGNDQVGRGKMTITESVPNERVVEDLQFFTPFEAQAVVTMTLAAEGDKTRLTWAYDHEDGFMDKATGLFLDMDAMLGADFQRGLDLLKPLAEKAAAERVAGARVQIRGREGQLGQIDADLLDEPDVGPVFKVVRAADPTFQACTAAALRVDPNLSGRLTLTWKINAGKVEKVAVVHPSSVHERALAGSTVGSCFQAAVEALKFDPALTEEVSGYSWVVSGP